MSAPPQGCAPIRVPGRAPRIAPGHCIDECPVRALFQDTDLPNDKKHFEQVNAVGIAR